MNNNSKYNLGETVLIKIERISRSFFTRRIFVLKSLSLRKERRKKLISRRIRAIFAVFHEIIITFNALFQRTYLINIDDG